MEGSISVRQGSEIVPIVPTVIRQHSSLAARGMYIEHHQVEPLEFPERELLQHNIFLYTGKPTQAEIKSPEFTGLQRIHPGSLWIMPEGSRHAVRFAGSVEGIALAFDQSLFDHLIHSADGKRSLPVVQSLAACPPKIDHMMRALMYESEAPSTEEGIGLECIATAIALALCQHAGAVPAPIKSTTRLAPNQVRRVQAYIEDNISRRITLADLSTIAELSSFHFLRSFKGSLGVTPARYVLDRRMERAKLLLNGTTLTVSAVGVSVGFDEVSHFSRAFRRSTGVAPLAFRNSLQNRQAKVSFRKIW